MKTILSALVLTGVLAGVANAQSTTFDPFNDPRAALPRSFSDDVFGQGSPSSDVVTADGPSNTAPFPQDVFPDVVVAQP